jgi:hypothetical protein
MRLALGLRKAAAVRLAELGAPENEIMAITGHRTSKEITRYPFVGLLTGLGPAATINSEPLSDLALPFRHPVD